MGLQRYAEKEQLHTLHCFKNSSHSVKDPKYSLANQVQHKIQPVLRSELAAHFLAHDTLLVLIYPLSKKMIQKMGATSKSPAFSL